MYRFMYNLFDSMYGNIEKIEQRKDEKMCDKELLNCVLPLLSTAQFP